MVDDVALPGLEIVEAEILTERSTRIGGGQCGSGHGEVSGR
jgi:hypothetical protein